MSLPKSVARKAGAYLKGPIVLGAALLMLHTVPAHAGDGVDLDLTVTNDEIAPIFVTIYDESTNPPYPVVMRRARISGFSSVPVSVSTDATGRANIVWTAISVDGSGRKCGHGSMNDLGNNASVRIQVGSDCTG
jgi:hypothetical protein